MRRLQKLKYYVPVYGNRLLLKRIRRLEDELSPGALTSRYYEARIDSIYEAILTRLSSSTPIYSDSTSSRRSSGIPAARQAFRSAYGSDIPPSKDPRDEFIARVAPNHSFIDIGGLSQVIYERVSVAHSAGASKLALMDVEASDCPWWAELRRRLDSKGVAECEFISGDIMTDELQTFDVVHSSGVLYHVPDPLGYIRALKRVCRKYCILTSTTIATELDTSKGILAIPHGAVMFLPSLLGAEREIVTEWFRVRGGREDMCEEEGMFGGYRNPRNYYANWFIPTIEALRAMAECCGFSIVDEAPVEADSLSYCLLLETREQHNDF